MEPLPKQFLSSLRILFDILDENRTGFIRLQDIESRWSDDGVRGLPPGVVEGLRKVTPPNGLLSFDRFVAGLKLVLVKRKDSSSLDTRKPLSSKENQFVPSHPNEKVFQNQRSQTYSQSNDLNRQNNDRYQGNSTNIARDDSSRNQHHPNQPRSSERIMTMTKRFDEQRHHSDSQEMTGNIPSPIQRPPSPTYPVTARDGYNLGSLNPRGNADHYQTHFKVGKNLAQFRRPMVRDQGQEGLPPALPPRPERAPRVSLQQSKMRKSQSGPDLASQLNSPPAVPPRHASSHVIADLKNWQAGWKGNGHGHQQSQQNLRGERRGGSASPTNRNPDNHDNAIYGKCTQIYFIKRPGS